MAARYKYQEWLQPEKLEQITNWAAKGLNNQELAQSMGIRRSTLHEWVTKHSDISDAIKKGRSMSCAAIENRLFMLAMGMVDETVEVVERTEERDKNTGKMVVTSQQIRKTTTHKAPNATAMIFYLKNRAGYSDNPAGEERMQDSAVSITFRRDL